MILGFKKQFVPKILDGSKIHTIREDKHNRWHYGRQIHFATGVRTPDYNCFKESECTRVSKISIQWPLSDSVHGGEPTIRIHNNVYCYSIASCRPLLELLALNDGFDSYREFVKWFNKDFEGKIIHWTQFRYA